MRDFGNKSGDVIVANGHKGKGKLNTCAIKHSHNTGKEKEIITDKSINSVNTNKCTWTRPTTRALNHHFGFLFHSPKIEKCTLPWQAWLTPHILSIDNSVPITLIKEHMK